MNLDPDDEDDTDDGAPRNQSEGSVLRVRELIAKKEQSEQASQQQSVSNFKHLKSVNKVSSVVSVFYSICGDTRFEFGLL